MRSLVAMLILLSATGSAHAQLAFSLEPAQAHAGQGVRLRIDSPTGCYPVPQIDVLRAANVVTVNLHVTDAGPCLPEWATPRFVTLGSFGAGNYEIQPFLCGNAPPPAPACLLQTTLPLVVVDSTGIRHVVPTLTDAAAGVLLLLLLIFGLSGQRRMGS